MLCIITRNCYILQVYFLCYNLTIDKMDYLCCILILTTIIICVLILNLTRLEKISITKRTGQNNNLQTKK